MKNLSFKFLVGLVAISTYSIAQEQEKPQNDDMYSLSLEELMNVPIKSASKKEETLFDAPLSSYTITRNDIDRAGSTSIMEALRLAPGVIVREQANGVYDIHIRGMDNLTRTNGQFLKSDSYTLVMIDNRPVFNHGLGGTYWESLPVDINDVDRIEIVRGPSSPLFGPNAVTGVINIITKRMNDSKTLVNATVQAGSLGTSIANISLGKSPGKFSSIVSANFQDRQRVDTYYNNDTTFVPLTSIAKEDKTLLSYRYPHPSRSLNKWGVNGYFNYKFNEKANIDLSVSRQLATSQRLYIGNQFEYSHTDNTAVNLAASISGLKIRTSYLDGFNGDARRGVLGGGATFNGEVDFKIGDVMAEYDIKVGSNYTITPGVSYQSVEFDDTKYHHPELGQFGYFGARHTLNTTAVFVRSDLNFTKKLRLIAAGRVDKFSVPNKAYLAYEFAGTYKINSQNLFRVAVTRSNSGSFMGYNFLNIAGASLGDTNLKIFTLSMIEVGYRSQLANSLQLDIDVFTQTAKNLSALLATQFSPTSPTTFGNIPTTATQIGSTISLNFVPNDKIQFKPFVTFQQTKVKDFPSSYLDPTLQVPAPYAVTYSNDTHKSTPGMYGGFYFNYKPVAKFNINVSSYFFGKHEQYDKTIGNSPEQYSLGQIASKFVLNAKASYEVVKSLHVFVNARNLGSNSREFFAADRTSGLYLAGASFNFNK